MSTPVVSEVKLGLDATGIGSKATSLTTLPAVGDYIYVAVVAGNVSVTGATCVDNQSSQTFSSISVATDPTNGYSVQLWRTKVVVAAGTYTVSTFNPNASAHANIVFCVKGADASTPLDDSVVTLNDGTSSKNSFVANLTSTQVNDLLLVVHSTAGSGAAQTPNYYLPDSSVLAFDFSNGVPSTIYSGQRRVNSIGPQSIGVSVPVGQNMSYAAIAILIKGKFDQPLITVQPTQQTSAVAGTATFTLAATASAGSNTYQWQVAPITSLYENVPGTWANVSTGSGGTTASYTTASLTAANNGSWYRCTVTDSNGSTTTMLVRLFIAGLGATGKGTTYGQAGLTGWFVDRKNSRKDSFGLLRRMRGDSQ